MESANATLSVLKLSLAQKSWLIINCVFARSSLFKSKKYCSSGNQFKTTREILNNLYAKKNIL